MGYTRYVGSPAIRNQRLGFRNIVETQLRLARNEVQQAVSPMRIPVLVDFGSYNPITGTVGVEVVGRTPATVADQVIDGLLSRLNRLVSEGPAALQLKQAV